jgi:hypothetical protein
MTENEEFEFRARREKEQTQKKPQEPEGPGIGEKAGALAYGATTGLVGGLGELEKFGAYDVPEYLGLSKPEERGTFAGRETIFPTIKEVESGLGKVGIKKPSEEVSGYETGGQLIGGLGTSLPSLIRGGVKGAIGLSSKVGEESAKAAEKLGFKIAPAQVRRVAPSGERGASFFAEHNQDIANKLASQGTGETATEITDKFIGKRLKSLGDEFDKVYTGKTFRIDPSAVDAIKTIAASEGEQVAGAAVTPVKQAAQDIINKFEELSRVKGAKPNTFGIEGEALQRLRNSLTAKARSTNATNAHEIYELVDEIDASIARNHPDVAAKLGEIRPQYRNSIILEDLYRSGGIHNGDISLDRLGNMLRKERSAVRKTGQDIDDLAKIGKNLKLRATWEPTGAASTEESAALQRALGSKLGLIPRLAGSQTRGARAVQRFYSTPSQSTAGKIVKGALPVQPTAYGTATRPLQGEEQ